MRASTDIVTAGTAHLFAHHTWNLHQYERGRTWLARYLDRYHTSGSLGVHLHWHLALFELELGDWTSALERAVRHVLPAVEQGAAITDAPSLLYRLRLRAPEGTKLPWGGVAAFAEAHVHRSSAPIDTLHHLLALAGAGNLEPLERFAEARSRSPVMTDHILRGMALGLLALEEDRPSDAAHALRKSVLRLGALGGSHAQRALFQQLLANAEAREEQAATAAERELLADEPPPPSWSFSA